MKVYNAGWSDCVSGTIGFSAKGVSHNEFLDTFFIVRKNQIADLLKGDVVEASSEYYQNKWKPKKLSFDIKTGLFSIMDPSHLAEVNGRKKLVEGVVNNTIALDEFKDLLYKSFSVLFFDISLMPFKTSKEQKAYWKERKAVESMCNQFFNAGKIALEANCFHYTHVKEVK